MCIGLCNGSSGSCSDRSSYSVALSGTLPGPSQRPLGRSAIMFMSSFDILSIFSDIFAPVHALPLPPTEHHSWAGLTFSVIYVYLSQVFVFFTKAGHLLHLHHALPSLHLHDLRPPPTPAHGPLPSSAWPPSMDYGDTRASTVCTEMPTTLIWS